MDNGEWLLIIALAIGLAGTILPMVPGLGLMFIALLAYSYYDNWQTFPLWYLVLAALLALAGTAADHLASALGAKRYGVSQRGFWGALLGGLLGGLFLQLVGLIIGAVIGTIIVELYQKRTVRQSVTAATGVLVGTAVGMAVQFGLGLVIIISAIWQMLL